MCTIALLGEVRTEYIGALLYSPAMCESGRKYLIAGLCILAFILAQTFQAFAYWFWLPASSGPQDDLLTYQLPVDQVRSLVVMSTIALLIVPYVIIAIRFYKTTPVLSVVGLIFGTAFIGFEVSVRSLDFFVVGQTWAHQFQLSMLGVGRDALLHRFALWNEIEHGWYFPLMMAHLLASAAFAAASLEDSGPWHRLATLAFLFNALRLLGRLLSTFAGQTWLAGLNDRFYFPAVLVINALLMFWLFRLAKEHRSSGATC
jgi:hypothetical protein